MQWHQARQQVLAENVANADTPNYQARDSSQPDFHPRIVGRFAGLWARTDPGHIVTLRPAAGSQFATDGTGQIRDTSARQSG